jgi:hypothetical protein
MEESRAMMKDCRARFANDPELLDALDEEVR